MKHKKLFSTCHFGHSTEESTFALFINSQNYSNPLKSMLNSKFFDVICVSLLLKLKKKNNKSSQRFDCVQYQNYTEKYFILRNLLSLIDHYMIRMNRKQTEFSCRTRETQIKRQVNLRVFEIKKNRIVQLTKFDFSFLFLFTITFNLRHRCCFISCLFHPFFAIFGCRKHKTKKLSLIRMVILWFVLWRNRQCLCITTIRERGAYESIDFSVSWSATANRIFFDLIFVNSKSKWGDIGRNEGPQHSVVSQR